MKLFHRPTGGPSVTIPEFLRSSKRRDLFRKGKRGRVESLPPRQRDAIRNVRARAREEGWQEKHVIVDVREYRDATYGRDFSPTLTSDHCASFAYWHIGLGRRLSQAELEALQGLRVTFPPSIPPGVRAGMVGNAIPVPVLAAILKEVLACVDWRKC